MDSVNTAVQNITVSSIELIPSIIATVLVLVLGWVVAFIVSRLFAGLLRTIKLEEFLKTHKVEDALGSVKISDVLTKIVKYYVLLIFIQAAVSYVAPQAVVDFLGDALLKLPLIISAIIIVLIAVIFGEYLKEAIVELDKKSATVKLSARAVKLVVIYIGVTMGLDTVHISTTILTGIFLTVIQAVAFGIALALGIAFGLGGQEDAKEVIKSSRKNLKV
jgi:hypothetical protein